MVDLRRVTYFSVRKISSEPSQVQVDQEGHRDLPTILSLTAIPAILTAILTAIPAISMS